MPCFVFAEAPLETPKLFFDPDNVGVDYFRFSGHCSEVPYDCMVAEISTKSDYSNPIVLTKKFSYSASNNLHYYPTNLQKNTRYYVRVKVVRGNESSGYSYLTVHTTRDVKYTKTLAQPLIEKMKKNRPFTYWMEGCYSGNDIRSRFLKPLYEDYPQYAGRYDMDLTVTDNCAALKYTPIPKEVKKCKKLTKVINSIVKGANKKKGRKAKVKYINKRICRIAEYTRGARCSDDYTAYGCLVKHRAVCMGYAHAFRAVAVQCNIPVKYDDSVRLDHVWNMVKIKGKWLHVDVTWNDYTDSSRYLLKKSHKH